MDISTSITQAGLNQYKAAQETKLAEQALGEKTPDELKEACREFETLFIKQMLDAMRSTVHKNPLIDGGQGEEIFEDMLYDEYADKMSRTANLGLQDMLYSQLKPGQAGLS